MSIPNCISFCYRIANYHKASGVVSRLLSSAHFLFYRLFRPEVQSRRSRMFSSGFHPAAAKVSLVCIHIWRLTGQESVSKLIQLFGRIFFLVVA